MELFIVRHGETLWNKDRRLQGSTDISLNDYGRELAVKTGQALKDVKIDKFCNKLALEIKSAKINTALNKTQQNKIIVL